MKNYIYIVECSDSTYYTGWTNDLFKRIEAHNSGKGAKYTKYRTPIKLVYYEAFESKQEAMKREYAIKQLTRKEKEELITKRMNMKKNILFDLDGTLTDSGEGIIKCAKLALAHYDIKLDERQLRTFIGPPLADSFRRYGVEESEIDHAISLFRERYLSVGKFENKPYEGVVEMLERLSRKHDLYVATSKPEATAKEILDHFDMSKYFKIIAGATMDEKRSKKTDVLNYLIDMIGHKDNMIMVGDTEFDIIGAKNVGLDVVAVSYGYGENKSLSDADAIVKNVAELEDYLR